MPVNLLDVLYGLSLQRLGVDGLVRGVGFDGSFGFGLRVGGRGWCKAGGGRVSYKVRRTWRGDEVVRRGCSSGVQALARRSVRMGRRGRGCRGDRGSRRPFSTPG